MTEKARRVVGIDLGTTNTLVASVRNRVPRIVPTDKGNLILPSVVALSPKGDLVVGAIAKDQIVTNPHNTIRDSTMSPDSTLPGTDSAPRYLRSERPPALGKCPQTHHARVGVGTAITPCTYHYLLLPWHPFGEHGKHVPGKT